MSRPNKHKVPTRATPSGLFQAFAGLNIGGLPTGPADPGSVVEAPDSAASLPPSKKGRVILRRETAHRGGKTVVVIHGFEPSIASSVIEDLAKRLRTACGCGGSTKARTIEIQGEQVARLREILTGEGFRVDGEK